MEKTDVALIGAGPIGLEIAVALKKRGIRYIQFDAGQIGSTIASYPPQIIFHSAPDKISISGVPFYTADQSKAAKEDYLAYLRCVVAQFDLQVKAYERVEFLSKEGASFLLTTRSRNRQNQYFADKVVLAIGNMHRPRMLGVAGENLPHVNHYFTDPHQYFRQRILVVGGRNSALEAAIRCQRLGAQVTLSYRRPDFNPDLAKYQIISEVNGLIREGLIRFLPETVPVEVRHHYVLLSSKSQGDGKVDQTSLIKVEADFVLLLTGYEQDSSLFDGLGVRLEGVERRPWFDPATMETNVKGVYVAGTAIGGTQNGTFKVIIEKSHIHVDRIIDSLTRVYSGKGDTGN